MGFLATLLVVSPTLGQIQFTAQQCVSTQTGIRKKHAHLAVLMRPAVLLYARCIPTDLRPFFRKPVSSTSTTSSGVSVHRGHFSSLTRQLVRRGHVFWQRTY